MKLNSYQNLRVPNFSVHVLREMLEDAGLDWRGALQRADIAPDAVQRPGGTIPAKKELEFQLEFVSLTGHRIDLWVRAARAYVASTTGARGMALATAPTVAAWTIAACTTDYAPGLLEIAPLRGSDGTIRGVEYTYPDAPPELLPFSVYRELIVTSRSLSWLYAGRFPFTRVEVPLTELRSELLPDIDSEIATGSDAVRFWWSPETATQALPYGNAFQHSAWVRADARSLDEFRNDADWPATVAGAIKRNPESNRKLSNVAVALRVSTRTLQRKLELAGRDFAQVRDDALRELAADLLSNTDHSVAHISRTLGYADPASFTIAFKRWTGVPPSAFREASRYADDARDPTA